MDGQSTPLLAIGLFVLLGVGVAAQFGLMAWIFRRLKSNHGAVYESMGSPSLFWNNSLSNVAAFLNFLWGNKYRALEDPALTRVCGVLRGGQAIYILVFGFAVLAIFLGPLLSSAT